MNKLINRYIYIYIRKQEKYIYKKAYLLSLVRICPGVAQLTILRGRPIRTSDPQRIPALVPLPGGVACVSSFPSSVINSVAIFTATNSEENWAIRSGSASLHGWSRPSLRAVYKKLTPHHPGHPSTLRILWALGESGERENHAVARELRSAPSTVRKRLRWRLGGGTAGIWRDGKRPGGSKLLVGWHRCGLNEAAARLTWLEKKIHRRCVVFVALRVAPGGALLCARYRFWDHRDACGVGSTPGTPGIARRTLLVITKPHGDVVELPALMFAQGKVSVQCAMSFGSCSIRLCGKLCTWVGACCSGVFAVGRWAALLPSPSWGGRHGLWPSVS
jgi:hypothetical protein